MRRTLRLLALRRASAGFSQTELAEAMGVSPSLVRSIEKGTRTLSFEFLDKCLRLPRLERYREALIHAYIMDGGKIELGALDGIKANTLCDLHMKWGALSEHQLITIAEVVNE